MITQIKQIVSDFAHLFFPANCEGCGSDTLMPNSALCVKCFFNLPNTGHEKTAYNQIMQRLNGRVPLQAAMAGYYFRKEGVLRTLIHELKYRDNQNVGIQLGRMLGKKLSESHHFDSVDMLMPIPLNRKRLRKRGYNQAQIICEGIIQTWKPLPIATNLLVRSVNTGTQTKLNRVERSKNVEGVFEIADPTAFIGKHIAIVDDVITTGSTIEAAANEIKKIKNTKISIIGVALVV